MDTRTEIVVEPEVVARGEVPHEAKELAAVRMRHACEIAPGRVRSARVILAMAADPARERPASARATLDIDGHVVRAHAESRTMGEAVDLVYDRVRRGLRDLHDRGLPC